MNLKFIFGFAAGALFGGALGAYLMKSRYEEESQQAIDAVKDFYRDMYHKNTESKEPMKEKQEVSDASKIDDLYSETEVKDYNAQFTKYVDETKNYADLPPAENQTKPYIISEDEFLENEFGYRQEDLKWYGRNKMLVDENDDVIVNPEIYVGNDISKRFEPQGGYDNFIDEIFIRNDNLSTDYHITNESGVFMTDFEGDDV